MHSHEVVLFKSLDDDVQVTSGVDVLKSVDVMDYTLEVDDQRSLKLDDAIKVKEDQAKMLIKIRTIATVLPN